MHFLKLRQHGFKNHCTELWSNFQPHLSVYTLPEEHVEEFCVETSNQVQEELQGVEIFSVSKIVSCKHRMDLMTHAKENL